MTTIQTSDPGLGHAVLSLTLSGSQRPTQANVHPRRSQSVQVFYGATLLDTITVAFCDRFTLYFYDVSGAVQISFANAGRATSVRS